ncbi:MAG: penicillin-binding transpeptidase domain-containing protein, partial [Pseudomonadota bacterium]
VGAFHDHVFHGQCRAFIAEIANAVGAPFQRTGRVDPGGAADQTFLNRLRDGKDLEGRASLPDFDPNDRPRPLTEGDQAESPLFNRAVQGLYELGSTFKIFAVAQAIEERLVSRSTWIDTTGPLKWGTHRIRDFRDKGPALIVEDVIVESSNIGTARVAMMIGAERQQDFLRDLGLFDALPVELIEATGSRPLLPKRWSEIHTMTVSYGHGLSASPFSSVA